ncbi:NAD(P)-binding domain-containing protein [Limnobacter sp.]|uniref:flavin-containing monooxygenase n=1 Tax=Limnobacter sp. TaxID=2003368 RepID=UPI0035159D69
MTKRKVQSKALQSGSTARTSANPVQKRSTSPGKTRSKTHRDHVFDTLIIGAGFAGLGSAIKLRKAGVHNIAILERAAEVGGTWRDNQYPGAACDIPSNLYSFSFAPNPAWSRSYSGAQEILAYVHSLVNDFGLQPFIHYQQNVTQLELDEAQGLWVVHTSAGAVWRGRSVIMASGPLANASFPNIRGLERFQGKKIHSAQWDHSYSFEGKKVGVIGTGASAIQIVPELVKRAGSVKVFQRTPPWVMPRPDFTTSSLSKALFAKLPFTQKAIREALYWAHESMALAVIWDSPVTKLGERLGRAFLETQVKDPWLRRQLTPDYKLGCKRILVSNDYYPALQQANCELITWPIAGIVEQGIRTAEGIEHQFDCLVFATGFDVPKSGTPYPIIGVGGRVLAQEWARGAQAYKSINVSGYPNLFIMFGPNSGPGHNSALVYMEQQIAYAVKGIRTILDGQHTLLDVKPEVQQQHNQRLQKRLSKTNWNSGCTSWYLTEDGFNATMFPGFATQYARQMKHFDLAAYRQIEVPAAA